jgi:hypothetical protein
LIRADIAQRGNNVKNIGLKIALVAGLATFALATIPTDASAAMRHRSPYQIKKAECTAKANKMTWGIHRIKRNRWIKNCIAGA